MLRLIVSTFVLLVAVAAASLIKRRRFHFANGGHQHHAKSSPFIDSSIAFLHLSQGFLSAAILNSFQAAIATNVPRCVQWPVNSKIHNVKPLHTAGVVCSQAHAPRCTRGQSRHGTDPRDTIFGNVPRTSLVDHPYCPPFNGRETDYTQRLRNG
jgi:hypothetical protein